MRISQILRTATLALTLTAALSGIGWAADGDANAAAASKSVSQVPAAAAAATTSPWHPERNPLWNVRRNGANQPVDQNGIPLPGYALGPN